MKLVCFILFILVPVLHRFRVLEEELLFRVLYKELLFRALYKELLIRSLSGATRASRSRQIQPTPLPKRVGDGIL